MMFTVTKGNLANSSPFNISHHAYAGGSAAPDPDPFLSPSAVLVERVDVAMGTQLVNHPGGCIKCNMFLLFSLKRMSGAGLLASGLACDLRASWNSTL